MLLPPLSILKISNASFTPSEMSSHRLSGGRGYVIETSTGNISIIGEDDGSIRIQQGRGVDRDYTVSVSDEVDPNAMLDFIGLQPDTTLDESEVFPLALALIEGLRWRPADGLVHDEADRRSYILNALADPLGFLDTIQLIVEDQAQEEEEKEEVVEVKQQVLPDPPDLPLPAIDETSVIVETV